ncbi:hypothetical protein C8J55DRAFT_518115 [Lentinula edodes]|uniref:Uncharacterized protein n=1 Tax=Lentinula lateritia TaxID=40482 RepID=A0A9W9A7G8_9AGAR|nr:hypothetical protein C8J55DRAFT_518115 [Lentinula edodes]
MQDVKETGERKGNQNSNTRQKEEGRHKTEGRQKEDKRQTENRRKKQTQFYLIRLFDWLVG